MPHQHCITKYGKYVFIPKSGHLIFDDLTSQNGLLFQLSDKKKSFKKFKAKAKYPQLS